MNSLTLEPPKNKLKKKSGEPYLKLQLDEPIQAVLPLKNAQEVVIIPAQRITLMPNMNDCILGLLNQRSRVLWVVDLAQMLGLESVSRESREYNITIVRVGNIPLALVVKKVLGVMRLETDLIQSSVGNITPELTPYLRGCLLEEKRVLLVLDAEAIVKTPTLTSRGN